MKKVILSIGALALFLACKKNSSNTTAVPSSVVTSIRSNVLAQHTLYIDSFTYDNNQNITQIIEWYFDSTLNPILGDSSIYSFTFTGGASVPGSYTRNEYTPWSGGSGFDAYQESHTLSYDNQNRIQLDTSFLTSTTGNSARSSNYIYSASAVVANNIGYTDATDTAYLNNGNLIQFSAYTDNLQVGAVDFINYYPSYSNSPNPLYNKNSSASIGALLYVQLSADFISKNLPAEHKDAFGTDQLYSWITNSSGKVTKGTATDKSTTQLQEVITFNYR